MIRDVVLAFNDWVGTDGSYTSDQLAARIGRFEQIAVQATFDTLGGNATGLVLVEMYHSADGIEWLYHDGLIEGGVDPAGSLPNSYYGSSTTPILPFVRFLISSTIPAHARLYAILRDPSD